MIDEEILVNVTPQETRVAVAGSAVVQEILIERAASRGFVGNIYMGRVARVLPGMQSAFVEIGLERAAFLHVADVWGDKRQARPIEKILAEGQPILVQVNIAREEQKHGCLVEDVPALIEDLADRPNLALRGLMTMAPLTATAEEARPVFVGLRKLRDSLREHYPSMCFDDLSMGMSNDFTAAIEEGATIVRIGTALFGTRAEHP